MPCDLQKKCQWWKKLMVQKKRKVALNLVLKNYGDHKKAQECLA